MISEGVEREEIRNFFIPGHNILTVSDHENKLRLCVVEDMLNQMKGQQLVYTPEVARERKQQIRVFEIIDLLDYIISGLVAGKNLTAVWNKAFVNIGDLPSYRNTGWFWDEFTDLNTADLSKRGYKKLVQIWSLVEDVFKQLFITLEGELSLLSHKLYIRIREKKNKFELEHKGYKHKVEQINIIEGAFEWLEDLVDWYFQEDNTTLPHLHKAVCREFNVSGLFRGIADVTEKEGSVKGLARLKETLKLYRFIVPDEYMMNAVVDYVSQLFTLSKEVFKCKLDYITIPELDLD